MVENKNKQTTKKYNPEVCELLHKELNEKISKLENIDHKKDLEKIEKSLKDEMETTKNSIMNKIGTLDETIRGNGKIGLQEQSRSLNRKFYILAAIVLFILGFKVLGTKWDDIFGREKENTEIKQVEKIEENTMKNIEKIKN